MVTKKLSAIILAVIVVAVEATTYEYESQPAPKGLLSEESEKAAPKWEGLGLSADVNHYVDSTIHMLGPFMQENGLDPMPLPDVAQGFEVRPILITYSAWLRIHSGSMSGLVNVARADDQMVHYFAKMLRIKLRLQFFDLRFDYRYLVQVMNIGPTGGIVATLDRFIVNVDLLIDFNNDEIHLQEFALSQIGRLRVRLTGNILIDWLITPVINTFLLIFDNVIIHIVVGNIRNFAQEIVFLLNREIAQVIRILESIGV